MVYAHKCYTLNISLASLFLAIALHSLISCGRLQQQSNIRATSFGSPNIKVQSFSNYSILNRDPTNGRKYFLQSIF